MFLGVLAAAVALALPLGASSATTPGLHSNELVPGAVVRPQSGVPLADGRLRAAVTNLGAGRSAPAGVTVRSGQILVEILLSGDAADVRQVVNAAGGTVNGQVGNTLLQAYVPYGQLVAVEHSPGVRYLRPPLRVDEPTAGSRGDTALALTVGEELQKTNAAAWQAAGLRGAGVKVGIVDSFDLAKWNAAQAAGEVPVPAGTFCRNGGADCTSTMYCTVVGCEHGVAVAEVIHEMAPDAQIYLASATTTADLQAAVDYFQANGVTILSRSLTAAYDGPGDGTGPIAAVVASAVSKGIAWFNSAGNSAGNSATGYVGSYWRGPWVDANGNGWLDFAPGDEGLAFRCAFVNGLRWNDWGALKTDYDLYIYADSNLTQLENYSIRNQATPGVDPLENAFCVNDSDGIAYLAVQKYADGNGTAGDMLEFMVNGSGLEYWQNAFSAAAPAVDVNDAGAVAVGAIEPWNGVQIAPYSSQGPTNDSRIKPDLSAASCVANYTYAHETSPRCFNGTSAATPVAAGAAALVEGAGLAATPAQLRSWIMTHAVVDRGAAGLDNIFGAGELILPAPPSTFNPAANPSVDFDGNGMTDLGAMYRGLSPADSLWYAPGTFQIYFGATTDVPVPGDYDGDGRTDAVIFRPSTGLWYGPRTGAAQIVIQMNLGQAGDVPIPGDYDGDGKTDPAIYRPSTGLFFAVLSGGGVKSSTFGAAGDVPVPRDYDRDGKTDFAIYRQDATPQHLGLWYSPLSGGGVYQIYFGAPGDIPVPGDYNGDKRAEAVIFRSQANALWYGPYNGAPGLFQLNLGTTGDVPIPGYYDNNLAEDPAIYRKTNGLWFALLSGGGVAQTTVGVSTDVPVQKRPALAGGL